MEVILRQLERVTRICSHVYPSSSYRLVGSYLLPTLDVLYCVDDYKFDGAFVAFPRLLRNNKISCNDLLSCLKNA